MDQATLQLLRDLGVTGILGLALFAVAKTIAPLIQALVAAYRENANIQQAIMARWEASDNALHKNTAALEAAARWDAAHTAALDNIRASVERMEQALKDSDCYQVRPERTR